MNTLANLKPGDLVVVSDTNFGFRTYKVKKVGRMLLHVEARLAPFDLATGRGKDGYGHTHVYTLDRYDRMQKVAKARAELEQFGVTIATRCDDGDKILAVREALDALIAQELTSRKDG
jgi:hypothetical protein